MVVCSNINGCRAQPPIMLVLVVGITFISPLEQVNYDLEPLPPSSLPAEEDAGLQLEQTADLNELSCSCVGKMEAEKSPLLHRSII